MLQFVIYHVMQFIKSLKCSCHKTTLVVAEAVKLKNWFYIFSITKTYEVEQRNNLEGGYLEHIQGKLFYYPKIFYWESETISLLCM